MNAYVLIVWLWTFNGPIEVRHEMNGQGRQCEAFARDLRLGTIPVPRKTLLIDAVCVREFDA